MGSGTIVGDVAKAHPFVEPNRQGLARFSDQGGDTEVTLLWNEVEQSANAVTGSGDPLPTTTRYWFAWFTFHPDTGVFTAISSE